jgi:hypothetical protein
MVGYRRNKPNNPDAEFFIIYSPVKHNLLKALRDCKYSNFHKYVKRMKVICIVLSAAFLFLIYTTYNIAHDSQAAYGLRDPRFMEQLTVDDIITACNNQGFHDLLIHGHISPGLYYTLDIFEDGSGLLYEAVGTSGEKDSLAKSDLDFSKPDFQMYKTFMDSLPYGDYWKYYKFSISREDIEYILKYFADEHLLSQDFKPRPGHGLGFGFEIFLNGKGKHLNGWMYEPGQVTNYNVVLRMIFEDVIIPIVKNNATEIEQLEFDDLKRESLAARAGKASYITIEG